MAYRIKTKKSVEKAIQRVAREQIDKAIAEIKDPELDGHETVHQVRKRCKKVRGLIRLVRPQLESQYDRENAWYRDSAQRLSYVRDAQSIIETFDALLDHFRDQIDREAFSPVRQQLTERRQRVAEDEVGLGERLDEFLDRMVEGRKRVAAWQLQDNDFSAVEGGLTKTYARGRAALDEAYQKPSAGAFHEWRKRAKYHWYHLRLLRPLWKEPVKARRDEADRLADWLGDDHDLAILRQTLLDSPAQFGGEETVQALTALINQRQVELRTAAKPLGKRLYAEKPKRFARRFGRYWAAWRSAVNSKVPRAAHQPHLITA